MPKSDKAIEVKNVYKFFGETKALNGVSLDVDPGIVYGLLGPNGAGKTTLVRILSTLTQPTKGWAKVFGHDVHQEPDTVRDIIGLAGQYAAIDEYLTGRENLYMVGRLYHLSKKEALSRAESILERLDLASAGDRTAKTYSGGMRRRLDLGASLIGHPKILFLDEPTTGLDPRSRQGLWEIIRELIDDGTSILLTTQYLEEADALAKRIAVIDRGKVIAEGTSDQLKKQLGGDVVEIEFKNPDALAKALPMLKTHSKKDPISDGDGVTVRLPVADGSKSLLSVVREMDGLKLEPVSVALHRPSLDDVFMSLTGSKASDVAKDNKAKAGAKR